MDATLVPPSRAQVDALIVAIETPMPMRWAALSEGVTPDQLKAWCFAGIVGADPECIRLAKRVYKSQAADVGKTFSGLLTLAEKGNPLAAETFLKLMHPADFGGKSRSEPDEFQSAERNRVRRARLLDDPPPRMRAELTTHRWVQLPQTMADADKAAIMAILERYRTAPALAASTEKAE